MKGSCEVFADAFIDAKQQMTRGFCHDEHHLERRRTNT